MFRQITTILLIAFLSATIGAEVPVSQRDARHLVQVTDRYRSRISMGAWVSPTHVVTLASSVSDSPEMAFVIVGAATRSGEGKRYAVKKVFKPANWRETEGMDIAVLKLFKRVPARKARVLDLCSKRLEAGDMIQVTGYGSGGQFWGNITDSFYRGTYSVSSHDECVKLYEGTHKSVSESSFCADEYRNVVGSTGGPAIHGTQVCGLVSGGLDDRPCIFTDVFAAKSFIEEAMSDDSTS